MSTRIAGLPSLPDFERLNTPGSNLTSGSSSVASSTPEPASDSSIRNRRFGISDPRKRFIKPAYSKVRKSSYTQLRTSASSSFDSTDNESSSSPSAMETSMKKPSVIIRKSPVTDSSASLPYSPVYKNISRKAVTEETSSDGATHYGNFKVKEDDRRSGGYFRGWMDDFLDEQIESNLKDDNEVGKISCDSPLQEQQGPAPYPMPTSSNMHDRDCSAPCPRCSHHELSIRRCVCYAWREVTEDEISEVFPRGSRLLDLTLVPEAKTLACNFRSWSPLESKAGVSKKTNASSPGMDSPSPALTGETEGEKAFQPITRRHRSTHTSILPMSANPEAEAFGMSQYINGHPDVTASLFAEGP